MFKLTPTRIILIGALIVALSSCASSKYDCAWKQTGMSGYGPAKTGKR